MMQTMSSPSNGSAGNNGNNGATTVATRIPDRNHNSVFREDQTDLLAVFQNNMYDLLGGLPPAHSPNFVPPTERRTAAAAAAVTVTPSSSSSASTSTSSSVGFDASNRNRNVNVQVQIESPSAFQEHHYDLLAGTPPSHNPDFVSDSDHFFVGRYEPSAAASAATATPSESMPVGFVATIPHGSRRRSTNTIAVPSNHRFHEIPAPASNSRDRNSSEAQGVPISKSSDFPIAAAVAISDEDSTIPFVSALRIDVDFDADADADADADGVDVQRGLHGASRVVEGQDRVEATSVQPVCRPPPLNFDIPPRASRANPNFPLFAEEIREGYHPSRGSSPFANAWPMKSSDRSNNKSRPSPSSYFPEKPPASRKNPERKGGTGGRIGTGDRASLSRISDQIKSARRSFHKKLSRKKSSKKIDEDARLVALFSKFSVTPKQRTDQERAISILKGRKISNIEDVDGSLLCNKDRRNLLFDISGEKGIYPQFFLQKGQNTIMYLGDFEWLQYMNDLGSLTDEAIFGVSTSNSMSLRSQPVSRGFSNKIGASTKEMMARQKKAMLREEAERVDRSTKELAREQKILSKRISQSSKNLAREEKAANLQRAAMQYRRKSSHPQRG